MCVLIYFRTVVAMGKSTVQGWIQLERFYASRILDIQCKL